MPVPGPQLTRREALALGAATGVVAAVGAAPATASASAGVVGAGRAPDYLRRSTFAPLVGEDFAVGSQTLRLTAVGDVLGAESDASLRGLDEAFALSFAGAADALAAGVHQLSHPLVGPFPLFLGPEGAADGATGGYGATVDRSVRVSLGTATQDDGARPAAATARHGARRRKTPLSDRDREVLEERRALAGSTPNRRRAAAREARLRLRAAYSERIAFKREQRARLLSSRSSFLRRPGR